MTRTRKLAAATFVAASLLLTASARSAPGAFLGAWLTGDDDAPAKVEDAAPRSPAAAAGLTRGDVVTRIGDAPVEDSAALVRRLERARPGDHWKLSVTGPDGEARVTSLTLGTWADHHRAAHTPVPNTPGQSVILAGRAIPIGAPVVTWKDPGGFDAYQTHCAFTPARVLPSRPAAGCKTLRRYAARRHLDPALAAVVRARGWTPELAAVQIDQVVIHYDVAWTSKNCFKVLHDLRGLSCHFMLDVDGTLYQSLDLVERARHAGIANDRSIGIEIAHPGPLELTRNLAKRYTTDAEGVRFDLGRLAKTVRTPHFVVRPARPTPIAAVVQGRRYSMMDYTQAQYRTLIRLLGTLARVLPRLRLAVPRDAAGQIKTSVLTRAELAAWSGLLGHYHVSGHKQDPGPAFDWDRVLAGARAVAAGEPQRK